MESCLDNVSQLESSNTDRIHLFQYSGSEEGWVAYGRSADNLQELVPEVSETGLFVSLPGDGGRLRRIFLSREQAERHDLLRLCISLDDDHAILSPAVADGVEAVKRRTGLCKHCD